MDYKYPKKNALVDVYRLKRKVVRNEGRKGSVLVKTYIGKSLWAYCNPIVSDQGDHDTASFPKERILVVINYRDGIKAGDRVKWGNKTMQVILPPDDYEGKHCELKLTCETVESDEDAQAVETKGDEIAEEDEE